MDTNVHTDTFCCCPFLSVCVFQKNLNYSKLNAWKSTQPNFFFPDSSPFVLFCVFGWPPLVSGSSSNHSASSEHSEGFAALLIPVSRARQGSWTQLHPGHPYFSSGTQDRGEGTMQWIVLHMRGWAIWKKIVSHIFSISVSIDIYILRYKLNNQKITFFVYVQCTPCAQMFFLMHKTDFTCTYNHPVPLHYIHFFTNHYSEKVYIMYIPCILFNFD